MLKIKSLQKTFNNHTENKTVVFSDFDLEVKEGELVAILGGNGCGKTTLFNLISGELKADNGTIVIEDKDIDKLPPEEKRIMVSKVYQDPSMGVSPALTVLENMALAKKKSEKFGIRKLLRKSDEEVFIKKLKVLDLGLENRLNTKVKYLSGGQRQALSLVMATMQKPKLLLLDEHTAALDPKTSKLIMERAKELIVEENITTLMISHNLRDALSYSNRVIMLEGGRIILDKPSKSLEEEDLIKIYAKNLQSA